MSQGREKYVNKYQGWMEKNEEITIIICNGTMLRNKFKITSPCQQDQFKWKIGFFWFSNSIMACLIFFLAPNWIDEKIKSHFVLENFIHLNREIRAFCIRKKALFYCWHRMCLLRIFRIWKFLIINFFCSFKIHRSWNEWHKFSSLAWNAARRKKLLACVTFWQLFVILL